MTAIDLQFAQHLHQLLLPLTEPLHEAFAFAHVEADQHMPAYKHAGRMAHIRSALIRAAIRDHLTPSLPNGWKLAGDPDRMGQTMLDHQDGQVRLRILKAARPKGIPHAGTNAARRAFWRNTPMFEFEQLELEVVSVHNLLLLWTPNETGAYGLRVARPLTPGAYRGSISTDFVMDLAPTRTVFEALEFAGEAYDDENLFKEDITEETEDGS